MKWPAWRNPPAPDDDGLRQAKQALAKARADEPRVAWIATEHKRRQHENHFGPKIAAALRGGPR